MISDRLKYIIDSIDYYEKVADIGTDHGYVSVELIKRNKASFVIASDISKPSLQKAINYIKLNNLENKIQTRCGDGIKILKKDEVDALVIAGMGGILISEIIKDSYDEKFENKIPVFILQPVQQQKDLRYFLYNNNFNIFKEDIIIDMEKVYHVIKAKKDKHTDENFCKIEDFPDIKKDIFLEYGILNIKEKKIILKDLLIRDIQKNNNLKNKLIKNEVDSSYINKIVEKIECLEEIYETL